MADLTITAADVRAGSNAVTAPKQAGATVTAGDSIYQKVSDSKYYPTDANVGAEEAGTVGIALTNAGADEYFLLQSSGDLDPGATLTAGEIYVASATSGGIAPASDGASGWYTTIIGYATTASNLKLAISRSGIARA